MKLPRMRFTVRRMMIAVIIVAALLGAFEAGRRWERANDSRPAFFLWDSSGGSMLQSTASDPEIILLTPDGQESRAVAP